MLKLILKAINDTILLPMALQQLITRIKSGGLHKSANKEICNLGTPGRWMAFQRSSEKEVGESSLLQCFQAHGTASNSRLSTSFWSAQGSMKRWQSSLKAGGRSCSPMTEWTIPSAGIGMHGNSLLHYSPQRVRRIPPLQAKAYCSEASSLIVCLIQFYPK